MELAHRLYGRLKWIDLFQPVINLCRTGFNLSLHTEKAIELHKDAVREDKILTELFVVNGELKKEGDEVKRSRLADTLELIAIEGADVFYTGELSLNIINKVNETGGILTPEDLASYAANLKKPLSTEFNGYTLFTPPPPSGGPELLFPLNVLSLYTSSSSSLLPPPPPPPPPPLSPLMYHRMVEAFKFMFALRSQLGDTKCDDCDGDAVWSVVDNMTSINYAAYVKSQISDDTTHNVSYYRADYATPPSDHGTSHISVLGPDGMAVSVTSSVNTYFGSKVVTGDGVILNNEMDDFSSPNITNSYGLRPSESNYISPGKRPLSSTCPVVAVKRSESGGTQYLITGASGGTRIPTSTAQVIWRVLSLNEPIDEAIEASRLHHQLLPNQVQVEASFPDDIITYLESKGHNVTKDFNYAVVQGVHVNEVGVVSAHSDSRKQGQSVVVT
ncbi:Glutathione hydrolase 1 proenzyme [Geodia barretti]|nr:Glutathione hydrolase 1 proenzyme [Geodia barretti]